jgi:hypothetical protein
MKRSICDFEARTINRTIKCTREDERVEQFVQDKGENEDMNDDQGEEFYVRELCIELSH